MAYVSEGTLTTDKREVAISETWDSDTDWNAYQSKSGIEVVSGTLQLAESALDTQGLVGHYDATQLTDDYSDGQSVDPWFDESGEGNDLGIANSSTPPTLQTDVVNGNAVVRFGGNGGLFASFASAEAEPNEVYIVVNNPGANEVPISNADPGSGDHQFRIEQSTDSDAIYNGNQFVTASESGLNALSLYTIVWDTTDLLRRNGAEVASGDAGTASADGILLGAQWGSSGDNLGNFLNGDICEVRWYTENKSGTRSSTEQDLADKWGITLA